jgi:hypothetical protein
MWSTHSYKLTLFRLELVKKSSEISSRQPVAAPVAYCTVVYSGCEIIWVDLQFYFSEDI